VPAMREIVSWFDDVARSFDVELTVPCTVSCPLAAAAAVAVVIGVMDHAGNGVERAVHGDGRVRGDEHALPEMPRASGPGVRVDPRSARRLQVLFQQPLQSSLADRGPVDVEAGHSQNSMISVSIVPVIARGRPR
jgi:hypothetical protein